MVVKRSTSRSDRRGRGETGAGATEWSRERELEDLEAVVNHAASVAGGKPVCLYGTSSGAVLAARAIAAGVKVKKLALHEPPLSLDGTNFPNPPDFIAQIERAIAAGDNLGAAKLFLRVVGVPGFAAFMMMLIPSVRRNFKQCTPTLLHDFAILGDTQRGGPLPDELRTVLTRINVPVMMAVGTKSAPYMHHAIDVVAQSLPKPPERVVLQGQDHNVAASAIGPELKRSRSSRSSWASRSRTRSRISGTAPWAWPADPPGGFCATACVVVSVGRARVAKSVAAMIGTPERLEGVCAWS